MSVILYTFGSVFVVASSSLNFLVVYVLLSMKKELHFKDLFIASVSFGDLLQTFLGYGLELCSMVMRENAKFAAAGLVTCKISGFLVTFLALSSICHLVVLAFDRYISVCQPFFASKIHSSSKIKYSILAAAWMYALLWGIFPLFNWSSYALEKDGQRCSINWNSQVVKDRLYIICLLIFCYLVPVFFMLYAFVSVKMAISGMKNRGTDRFGKESQYVKDTVKAETKHVRLAIIMCGVFILIWTPYAFLSFWAAFLEHITVMPSQLGTAAAYIAKSSTIINPFLYCFLYKKFRKAFKHSKVGKIICRSKSPSFDDNRREMMSRVTDDRQEDNDPTIL